MGSAILILVGSTVSAFQQGQPAVQFKVEVRNLTDTREGRSLVPPQDRDTESWLKRASEAAEREDWKLAADTIARVIEKDGHKTISPDDGKHFYSAGWYANKMIAAWPEEGQAAYRILYDGPAQNLFDTAMQTQELEPLRTIAYKYPMTSVGPAAIDLLTGWLLDRQRPHEALELLNRLTELPHNQVPLWRTLQKRAIAHFLADQRAEGSRVLQAMRDYQPDKPAARAPDDWPGRVESMQRAYEDAKLDGRAQPERGAHAAWNIALGPPAMSGRMEPINPTITRDTPWRDTLPGTDKLDPAEVDRVMRNKARMPVWQAVTDGRALFVTTPGGIVARDLATFDFLWQTFPTSAPREVSEEIQDGNVIIFQGGGFREETPQPQERLSGLTTRTLYHEYAGAVSTAAGLVFAIEQNTLVKEQFPSKDGDIPALVSFSDAPANSLRAFEASTGRAVWTKGAAGPAADELKDAHFFSTPVPAGDNLVATFLQRDELVLAVLKPDGTLVSKIVLGSGKAGLFPLHAVLQPTVVDGTIYVPTGAGLLIALNGVDYSLRWLSTYERIDQSTGSGRRRGRRAMAWGMGIPQQYVQPDEWLSSPPIAAGGVVILAAQDAEELFAFDRADGSIRWTFPRTEHRYLLGADAKHVYIAGQRVTAINLADGKEAWTYPSDQKLRRAKNGILCGRPVLSGDRILVPTRTDFVALSADNGEAVEGVPVEEGLLGNLMVVDGALYSIGVDHLSKYPDVPRTVAAAEARLKVQPGDVDALMRLAWLSAMQQEWPRVLTLLDQVRMDGEEARATEVETRTAIGWGDRVAHLRVQALLQLAAAGDAEERRAMLDRAVAEARRTDDVVNAGLALCDHFSQEGALPQAFGQALALLVQDEAAEQPMPIEANLEVRGSLVIGARLKRFWQAMNESQRAETTTQLQRLIQDARRGDVVDHLRQLADALEFTEDGARLDLELGAAALADDAIESGVFHLNRAVRRAAGNDLAIEALVRLAVAHLPATTTPAGNAPMPAAPAEAAAVLARLEKDFADRTMPAGAYSPAAGGGPASVKEFVAQMRGSPALALLDGRDRLPPVLRDVRAFVSVGQPERESDAPRLNRPVSFFDPVQGDGPFHSAFPILINSRLKGFDPAAPEGKGVQWLVDLTSASEERATPTFIQSNDPAVRSAAVDGRIAMLDLGPQLVAVGLSSGRMMWRPVELDRARVRLPEPPIAAIDGMMVAACGSNVLMGVPAREGAAPAWRRKFGPWRLRLMQRVGSDLVVIDRNAVNCFVLDPQTGSIRRQFGILVGDVRPDPATIDYETDDTDAHVAVVGSVVCRSGDKRVVGRDIQTGRVLWDMPLKGRVKGLCRLNDTFVGLTHRGERFAVVRADTGEMVKDQLMEGMILPPIEAVAEDVDGQPRLTVFARTDDEPAKYVLAGYPLGAGGVKWVKGAWGGARVTRRMMTASSEYVPVINYSYARETDRRPFEVETGRPIDMSRVAFYHKSTGERIGVPYDFDQREFMEAGFGGGRFVEVGDIAVIGNYIIGMTPRGFCLLTKEAETGDVSLKDPRRPGTP